MGLVKDKFGNLYGTTQACGSASYGTVFKLSKNREETILHSFAGGADGEFPNDGNLFIDKSGNLYGITSGGGSSGYGVVYQVSNSGKETVLYTFAGGTSDGCYGYGPVTMDTAGNLYGTTIECGLHGAGVVWKLSKGGKEMVLHNFGGTSDGTYPSGAWFWMRPVIYTATPRGVETSTAGSSSSSLKPGKKRCCTVFLVRVAARRLVASIAM